MADLITILVHVKETPRLANLGDLDSGVDDLIKDLLRGIEDRNNQASLLSYKSALQQFTIGYNDGLKNQPGPPNADLIIRLGYDIGAINYAAMQDAEARQQKARLRHYTKISTQIVDVLNALDSEIDLLVQAQQRPYDFLINQIRADNQGHTHISDSLVSVLSAYRDWTERILNEGVSEREIRELERQEGKFDTDMKLGIWYLFRRGPGEALAKIISASYKEEGRMLHDALHHLRGSPYPAQIMLKAGYDRIKLARQFEQKELTGV